MKAEWGGTQVQILSAPTLCQEKYFEEQDMSHASLIVAIDGSTPEENIEDAVSAEMAPFDENGEWFRDGSRWDWWVIGGRYSGKLSTASRQRVNYARKGDLDLAGMLSQRRDDLAKSWEEAMKEADPALNKYIYGIGPNDTRESYIDKAIPLSAFAFLSDLTWHERGRLGWFGTTIAPESGQESGTSILVSQATRLRQATIVTHNKVDDEAWEKTFYERFISSLPDDTWLVCVDYHT